MFNKTIGEILNRVDRNKNEIHQIIESINHSEHHHMVETMNQGESHHTIETTNHSELSEKESEVPATTPYHSSSSEYFAHLISNTTTHNNESITIESIAMTNESMVDVI